MEIARKYFDTILKPLGLTENQILEKDLPELKKSLTSINDLIDKHQSFPSIKLKMTSSARIVITTASQEAHFEIGILPVLLERKKLIIERLRSFESKQAIKSIKDLIDQVQDPDLKLKLDKELGELNSKSQELREEAKKLEKLQMDEKITAEERVLKMQLALSENKKEYLKMFLEKQSMATIVGAILLILITLSLIIGVLFQGQPTDMLNNALLVLLGYFFGQAVNKPNAA
jgi:Fe2+ transport system protein B